MAKQQRPERMEFGNLRIFHQKGHHKTGLYITRRTAIDNGSTLAASGSLRPDPDRPFANDVCRLFNPWLDGSHVRLLLPNNCAAPHQTPIVHRNGVARAAYAPADIGVRSRHPSGVVFTGRDGDEW